MDIVQPNKGTLLLSDPNTLSDSQFSRAVVLVAEHNAKGSVGFILNKPLPITLEDILPDFKSNIQVYNGGPVEQENLYFIHNVPHLIENSIEIAEGIYWGGDFKNITHLIQQNLLSEKNIKFFLGYSGWESDQLESEIEFESWIPIENNFKEEIISTEASNLWKDLIISLGNEYIIWANAPENPVLN